MRKLIYFITLVLLGGSALASNTKIKEYRGLRDYAKGESKGVAIDHDGVLSLAPQETLLFDANLPQVWRIAVHQGTIYAGAGSPATVIRVQSNGDTSTVFRSSAAAVFALCVDAESALWFAPSPGGEIYRYKNGEAKKVATVKATYVWDLLPFGKDILIATGEPGAIFRLDATGKVSHFFESNETHIRTLVQGRDGNLYAGSADKGLVYRFSPAGKPFVLYDSQQTEIFAVIPLENGAVWAAGASESLQRPAPAAARVTVSELSIEDSGKGEKGNKDSGELILPATLGRSKSAKSAIFKISANGVARNVWKGTKDRVQAICLQPSGSLLVGTGDAGKIYEVTPAGDVSLLLDLDPAQITDLVPVQNKIYAATANLGGGRIIREKTRRNGEYLSPVLDADIYARWGSLSWRSQGDVVLYARSGNSKKPDQTWSEWFGPFREKSGSRIEAPVARFLQWKAVLKSKGKSAPQLEHVTLGYMQENVAPEIESTTIYEPGIAFPDAVSAGQKQASPGSDDRESSSSRNHSGRSAKQVKKNGYQAIGWFASDANNDDLEFNVHYRRVGTRAWRKLVENYRSSVYSWDSRTLEDGKYVVKITVSDAPSNAPGDALQGEKKSEPFLIDNTAPEIAPLTLKKAAPAKITFRAQDAASRITRAYYAVDAGEWLILYPDDGIADSPSETFSIILNELKPGEHTITVKVFDQNDNVRFRHLDFEL